MEAAFMPSIVKVLVAATLGLSFVLGPARGADEIPEHVPPALRPFAPLVGTPWIGQFPDGDLTDEQWFEWVYGGRFLRNTHRVRNAAGDVVYEGETIFVWDPSNDRIAWWYWNTTGGHITGTMVETEQGWISEGENHAPSGQTPRVRGAMVDITSVSWESVQYFERDGEWIEQWTMTYRPMDGNEAPGASDSPLPTPPSPYPPPDRGRSRCHPFRVPRQRAFTSGASDELPDSAAERSRRSSGCSSQSASKRGSR